MKIRIGNLCNSTHVKIDDLKRILDHLGLEWDGKRPVLEEKLRELGKEQLRKQGVKDINPRVVNRFEIEIPDTVFSLPDNFCEKPSLSTDENVLQEENLKIISETEVLMANNGPTNKMSSEPESESVIKPNTSASFDPNQLMLKMGKMFTDSVTPIVNKVGQKLEDWEKVTMERFSSLGERMGTVEKEVTKRCGNMEDCFKSLVNVTNIDKERIEKRFSDNELQIKTLTDEIEMQKNKNQQSRNKDVRY